MGARLAVVGANLVNGLTVGTCALWGVARGRVVEEIGIGWGSVASWQVSVGCRGLRDVSIDLGDPESGDGGFVVLGIPWEGKEVDVWVVLELFWLCLLASSMLYLASSTWGVVGCVVGQANEVRLLDWVEV